MTEIDRRLDLAQQLIKAVREHTAPRAVLLEDRIGKALAYMEQVGTPNVHTLQHMRRHLTGEYDDLNTNNPAAALRDLFERRWVCRVVSTGYNNGASCEDDKDDPHGPPWNCGWRWQVSLTDEQAAEYGITVKESE